MTGFGEALQALEDGKRITRAGWNGKDMFAYLVPAASYPVQTGAAKEHFGEGAMVPYRAYFALKTVDGDIATWQPSTSDILAKDWEILSDAVGSSVNPEILVSVSGPNNGETSTTYVRVAKALTEAGIDVIYGLTKMSHDIQEKSMETITDSYLQEHGVNPKSVRLVLEP